SIPSTTGFAELPVERLVMLANAYVTGRMPRNAISVLDELGARDLSESPDVVAETDALRGTALDQISTYQWPTKVSLKWDSRRPRLSGIVPTQSVYNTQVLAGKEFSGWRLVGEDSSSIAFRDPNGLLRRVPIEGPPMENVDKESQVSGGVMVVVTPQGLIGIDLYHLLAGDGEAMLWSRGPSGDSGPVAKRRSTVTPFDDQIVRYCIVTSAPTSVIPEFKLGPVMGDRVLVLQGGELLAIDLFSAETIWRNSTAPKSGSVICDGNRVAVVSSSTDEVAVFDLRDGRKIETRPWKYGVIWAAAGSNVLCYEEAGEDRKYNVRIVDPFHDEVILRQESYSANRSDASIPCSYGRVVAGRYLAMLNNEGESLLWDIRDGIELGRPNFPSYPDLQGLQVLLLKDQLIMLPRRRMKSVMAQTRNLQTKDGTFHRTVHGVFAVSLADGTLQWNKTFDRAWGCTLTQPANTPLLLLSRSPYVYTTPSRRKSLDVMALDVRNGTVVDLSEGKPVESNNNALETKLTVQPSLSRVIAQIGSVESLTYTFGDPAITEISDDEYERAMQRDLDAEEEAEGKVPEPPAE
ncbi:MAG: PQQ-binding-like beta-propeller repeat protein, partial [Rubripirellula sp.]